VLQARSESLRRQLAQQAGALEAPLAVADRTREGARWLLARPGWLAAIAAIPLLLKPRRSLAWGLRLWGGWRVWRQVRALLLR
jgi:hypothetical protein